MIACKARFALCCLVLWAVGGALRAQDYLVPPLYPFDRQVRDYTQRHLSDTVRMLLFHSQFKVRQTGYPNSSGNLSNLQIPIDFAQLASSTMRGLAPGEIDRDLYNAERFTVHLYESFARRWDRMNPIPGLFYTFIVRSSAYPFIFMEAIDQYAFDLGTFPFTDDLKFRQVLLSQRQYGFAFRIIF
jgi:hypothetical protein